MTAPRCPRCGGADIVEWNLVSVPYPVAELRRGRFGGLVFPDYPTDYSAQDYAPAWETAEPEHYACRTCRFAAQDPAAFLPGHPAYRAAERAERERGPV